MKMIKSILLSALTVGMMGQMAATFADEETAPLHGAAVIEKQATPAAATEAKAICADCWKHGPFTDAHPFWSRVVTSPLRVVTAVGGAPVGFLIGAAHGTARAAKGTSESTFGKIPTTYSDPVGNAAATMLKAPLLAPLGVVGVLTTWPFGTVIGATEGTIHGINKGFMVEDKI